MDICSVLANLLDNAIEASVREDEKMITVDIKKANDMLIITVKKQGKKRPVCQRETQDLEEE